MLFEAVAGVATLLAVLIYRTGRVLWNHILTTPDLPDAYYVGGNWTTHCSLIQDPSSDDIRFCEDITFWDHHDAHGTLTDRLVLFGCDPGRRAWNTVMGPLNDPAPRGHLFLYSPRTATVHRLALEGFPAADDFHPLGIDIAPSRAGSPSTLFVVNHARGQTIVEQFMLDPAHGHGPAMAAQHVRTLRSPHFVSPNAIAMTSPTSFFVSNDHRWTRRLPGAIGRVAPLVETFAGLPLSWVAHVDVHAPGSGSAPELASEAPLEPKSGFEPSSRTSAESDWLDRSDDYTLTHTFAALGIAFANGVAISPSRAHLAVASTSLGSVHVYTLDHTHAHTSAPSLTFSHTIPVPFLPDNLAYDDDGFLIVTGHPSFPALAKVAADEPGAIAPSWTVALAPSLTSTSNASPNAMETLFQSDGSVFGTSSTTLRDAKTGAIYVAGLYEQGVLVCRP